MRVILTGLLLMSAIVPAHAVKCDVQRIVVDFGEHRASDGGKVDGEGYVEIRCSNDTSVTTEVELLTGLSTGQSNTFSHRLLRYSEGRRDGYVRYNMFRDRQRTQVWTDIEGGRHRQSARVDAYDSRVIRVPVYLRSYLRGFGLAGGLSDSVQASLTVR